MADGTTLPGTGDKIRDIDRGANGKTQVVQFDVGGASAEDLLVRGQQPKASSLPVTLASDEDSLARYGALTETAPGTDTASSGLNGRLQRIAQRLTSLIALVPASLGQKVMSASMAVVVASDQSNVPVLNAAGESHIGAVGGNSIVAGGTFNRPADTTAYAVGDLVANSTTAGSVTPVACAIARVSAGTGVVRRIRLSTTQTGLAGTEVLRVHLFKTSPTVANGDNGVFSANGITALALGYTDVVLNHVYNDGSKGFTNVDILFDATVQTIYALIETRTAITPTSAATFALALEVSQD